MSGGGGGLRDAREQLDAVEAVVAQAQHPALRCATLAEDVELIWRGRTQARKACEEWKADRDAAVSRAEAAEQAVQRVRDETAEQIAQAIEASRSTSPYAGFEALTIAANIARQHAKGTP